MVATGYYTLPTSGAACRACGTRRRRRPSSASTGAPRSPAFVGLVVDERQAVIVGVVAVEHVLLGDVHELLLRAAVAARLVELLHLQRVAHLRELREPLDPVARQGRVLRKRSSSAGSVDVDLAKQTVRGRRDPAALI